MNIEQAQKFLASLKACYPNAKLDELASQTYTAAFCEMNVEDARAAFKDITHTLKWFPAISEVVEAVDFCKARRLQWDDHVAREKRLSAAETAIMDPKSDIHKRVVGPNHQKFLDMLSGKIKLPEPEWMKRKKSPSYRPATENGYVPITDAERTRRTAILRQQAQALLAEGAK